MAEFQVIEEYPVTMAHMKEKLTALDKEKALTFRGEKTKAYLDNFTVLDTKEAEKFTEELKALDIPRLKDRHIVKILDIMPTDMDSLKIVFSGETLTINDDDLKKILDVIPQ